MKKIYHYKILDMSLINLKPRNFFLDSFADDFMNYDFPFTSRFLKFPPVNIEERDNSYFIKFFVPGMKKEDFRIELDKNVLYVSAELETTREEKERNFTLKEYNMESFRRSFFLPESINEDELKAEYKNGELWLTIPKKVEAIKPRKEIKVF